MSSFTDPLTVTKTFKGYKNWLFFLKIPIYIWVVSRKFRYYIGFEGSKEFIDVEEGEETDFATIPRIFWAILPPDGAYSQAAVVHDKICRLEGKFYDSNGTLIKYYSPEKASKIFKEAMEVLKVPKLIINIMYQAVLRFGPKWNSPINETLNKRI